jgi:hypothetical protein
MEISWTDHVRGEEGLQRVKEERNILQTLKRRKANWIGHMLRSNWLITYIVGGKIEGRAEVTERRGRRRKQVLDDHKEKTSIVEIER